MKNMIEEIWRMSDRPEDFSGSAKTRRMFWRADSGVTHRAGKGWTFRKNAVLDFSTSYFNAFPLDIWRDFTALSCLKLSCVLSGGFALTVCVGKLSDDNNIRQDVILEQVISASGVIDLPEDALRQTGVLGFSLKALSDNSRLEKAVYVTNIPDNNQLLFGICITTFRREACVKRLVNSLETLKHHVRIFVADNGNTLKSDDFICHDVRLLPGKNTGGSGGFARGIRAALDSGCDHILLMDDDCLVLPEMVDRTIAFFRILKPNFAEKIMLGGAMLNLDQPNILHSHGERFDRTNNSISRLLNNCDLSDSKGVFLAQNAARKADILPWWYCAAPAKMFIDSLPLPMFFQYDDVEFSLRHAEICKLTMPGAAIWHEPFAGKADVWREYYACRNGLVTMAIHAEQSAAAALRRVFSQAAKFAVTYRYKAVELIFRAGIDFIGGADRLFSADSAALHGEISGAGYTFVPAKSLARFDSKMYNKPLCSRVPVAMRKLLLNGLFLPKKRGRFVVTDAYAPQKPLFFRAEGAVFYNPHSGLAYAVFRDNKALFRLLPQAIKLAFLFLTRYKKIRADYQKKYPNYITEGSWEKLDR